MPTFETWSSATTCLILGVWLSVLLTVPLLILLVQTLHRVTHVAQTLDEILPANVTHSQLDVLKTQRLIRLYATLVRLGVNMTQHHAVSSDALSP